jgi:hypothetical protein
MQHSDCILDFETLSFSMPETHVDMRSLQLPCQGAVLTTSLARLLRAGHFKFVNDFFEQMAFPKSWSYWT